MHYKVFYKNVPQPLILVIIYFTDYKETTFKKFGAYNSNLLNPFVSLKILYWKSRFTFGRVQ